MEVMANHPNQWTKRGLDRGGSRKVVWEVLKPIYLIGINVKN